ncbi:hypothetical protein LTR37_001958 [Vermiconidia calcicola]|uniref:Uncharacterized protein n=1 Tax=Vermiconidia calcicola TaxID=1690605 RepID=A0ACC3NU72_9PEZI|nr:hypothetical protein LTR37_001958 [Vermiconidia calcicola]
MDLLESLIVPSQEQLAEIYNSSDATRPSQGPMAAATLSQPSSQEQRHNPGDQNPFSPPPSGQTNDENVSLAPSGFAELANLQSIDDFDKAFPYREKKPKLVAVRSKGNPEASIKFQHICDQCGLRPEFTFSEPFPGYFKATVRFAGEVVETTEPQPSKKQAKDAVCELAIPRVSAFESVKGGKKRKSVDVGNESPDVDRSENWIGMLLENAQQKKSFMPTYQEYRTETFPTMFSCSVSVAGGPLSPFGDKNLFKTKQDARAAAAREAVLWLRSAGLLQQSSVKRQKADTPENVRPTGQTGLTQAVADVDMGTEAAATPSTTSLSLPQQVHNLAVSLGFHQPQFRGYASNLSTHGEPVPDGLPFHDMEARFDERDIAREPKLAGPIGKVERVHGFRNTRNACCEKVLLVLEDIKRGLAFRWSSPRKWERLLPVQDLLAFLFEVEFDLHHVQLMLVPLDIILQRLFSPALFISQRFISPAPFPFAVAVVDGGTGMRKCWYQDCESAHGEADEAGKIDDRHIE